MRGSIAIAVLAGSVWATRHADGQIFVGLVSDFQSGTRQGWTSGTNPNPPTVLLNGHGPGDHALRVVATGSGSAGGKLVTFNRSGPWGGNYLSAGVTAISMDLNNVGNTELDMRLAINGAGGVFSTLTSVRIQAGSGWINFVFPISEADWGSVGGTNINATLSAVFELRILNNRSPAWIGSIEAGTILIDNITAIPGPASLAVLAVLGLGVRRRRTR